MTLKVYTEPLVTLLAKPCFMEPPHLLVEWDGDGTDGEWLAEYAGRICYMSQSNPAHRTTAEYLTNIMRQGHGSVLEHANYTVLAEGVSRSLSHELVRHRAGMAYSQLSQRYVDSSDAAFVMPPALLDTGDENLQGIWGIQNASGAGPVRILDQRVYGPVHGPTRPHRTP
jgi:thymidylate synthase (FAD)